MNNRGAHIVVHGVSHRYARSTDPVLDNINLEVQPGESLALVGRSGSGKSTLLHLMCGLAKPEQGYVEIDGAVVRKASPDWIMMFQSPSLYPWMTVSQNIGLGLKFAGRSSQTSERVEELLSLVQLPGMAGRNVQDLSGGQQQRVALARSMAINPRALLLDEPFSALDSFTRRSLQREVRKIARDKQISMVFVTHDVAEAAAMADRAVVMQAAPGRIVTEVAIQPDPHSDPSVPEFSEATESLRSAYEQTVRQYPRPGRPSAVRDPHETPGELDESVIRSAA